MKIKNNAPESFFDAEACALNIFRELKVLVPDVVRVGKNYILLSDIGEGSCFGRNINPMQQQFLGYAMANLHSNINHSFGFDNDNYCGVIYQNNNFNNSWADFFWQQRIHPLLNHPLFDSADIRKWLKLSDKIASWLDHNPLARLCHGDPWYNNFLFNSNNQVVMIDPCCAYTDSLFDLAYMNYFKMLTPAFKDGYNSLLEFPSCEQEIFPLYQLYLLLVHLHQCGADYLQPVRNSLSFFVD